jgi:hypothetical protein
VEVRKNTRKERSGLSWSEIGIQKHREVRRGCGKGKYPLCKEENVIRVTLRCSGTSKWRNRVCVSEWLNLNEVEAYIRKVNCINTTNSKERSFLSMIVDHVANKGLSRL